MRAVVAPMIADRTIYQALPGLLDALPEDLRSHHAGLSAAPAEHALSMQRHPGKLGVRPPLDSPPPSARRFRWR